MSYLGLDVWRRNGITFPRLRAYGQGASCDALLQIKADVLELEVERLNVAETDCLGAALLAARGADPAFPVQNILARVIEIQRTFFPRTGRWRRASTYCAKLSKRDWRWKSPWPRSARARRRVPSR